MSRTEPKLGIGAGGTPRKADFLALNSRRVFGAVGAVSWRRITPPVGWDILVGLFRGGSYGWGKVRLERMYLFDRFIPPVWEANELQLRR